MITVSHDHKVNTVGGKYKINKIFLVKLKYKELNK